MKVILTKPSISETQRPSHGPYGRPKQNFPTWARRGGDEWELGGWTEPYQATGHGICYSMLQYGLARLPKNGRETGKVPTMTTSDEMLKVGNFHSDTCCTMNLRWPLHTALLRSKHSKNIQGDTWSSQCSPWSSTSSRKTSSGLIFMSSFATGNGFLVIVQGSSDRKAGAEGQVAPFLPTDFTRPAAVNPTQRQSCGGSFEPSNLGQQLALSCCSSPLSTSSTFWPNF